VSKGRRARINIRGGFNFLGGGLISVRIGGLLHELLLKGDGTLMACSRSPQCWDLSV